MTEAEQASLAETFEPVLAAMDDTAPLDPARYEAAVAAGRQASIDGKTAREVARVLLLALKLGAKAL